MLFRTYNEQVFHMLHVITLCYLCEIIFGSSDSHPPFQKFIIIFNKVTKNRTWNSPNPGKKESWPDLNTKQTNNNITAFLSIWLNQRAKKSRSKHLLGNSCLILTQTPPVYHLTDLLDLLEVLVILVVLAVLTVLVLLIIDGHRILNESERKWFIFRL